MRKIISRPDPLQLPALPLPIHVRSVGYNEADCGWYERVPGRQKNFVQLFWCVQGIGEITLPDRTILLHPGETFHHLPGEDHIHRSCDPENEWRYYWFTFDGPAAEAFIEAYGYPRESIYSGECPVNLFLELEILVESEEKKDTALGQIKDILNSLGYQVSDTVQTSYLSMLQRKADKEGYQNE